jgi:hypothetical protein
VVGSQAAATGLLRSGALVAVVDGVAQIGNSSYNLIGQADAIKMFYDKQQPEVTSPIRGSPAAVLATHYCMIAFQHSDTTSRM